MFLTNEYINVVSMVILVQSVGWNKPLQYASTWTDIVTGMLIIGFHCKMGESLYSAQAICSPYKNK